MVLATHSRLPANLPSIMSSAPTASLYNKDNPFPARLTENRLLNKAGSHKETRHIVVNIAGSDLHYKVGDSLGVFATNRVTGADFAAGSAHQPSRAGQADPEDR
jgi:sulfite reductase alpha subunit-like flavoprotein